MPLTFFKPDIHGFKFRNSFSSKEIMPELYSAPDWLIPEGVWGLCGGMCFSALDYYFNKEEIPEINSPPHRGMPLFSELVKRQMSSLKSAGLINIIRYQFSPDRNFRNSLTYLSREVQWPQIKYKIDMGIPVTACLIRVSQFDLKIWKNHQVIVYGYNLDSTKVYLNIYDPNCPDRNDILIHFETGNNDLNAYQNHGPAIRGFLINPYDRIERITA